MRESVSQDFTSSLLSEYCTIPYITTVSIALSHITYLTWLKAPQQKPNRIQKPTAGARKKGAKRPEFLVINIGAFIRMEIK